LSHLSVNKFSESTSIRCVCDRPHNKKNNIRLCIYKMTAKARLNIVKINH